MTKKKQQKQKIRTRMKVTGEKYTEARRNSRISAIGESDSLIVVRELGPPLTPSELWDLGYTGELYAIYKRFCALGLLTENSASAGPVDRQNELVELEWYLRQRYRNTLWDPNAYQDHLDVDVRAQKEEFALFNLLARVQNECESDCSEWVTQYLSDPHYPQSGEFFKMGGTLWALEKAYRNCTSPVYQVTTDPVQLFHKDLSQGSSVEDCLTEEGLFLWGIQVGPDAVPPEYEWNLLADGNDLAMLEAERAKMKSWEEAVGPWPEILELMRLRNAQEQKWNLPSLCPHCEEDLRFWIVRDEVYDGKKLRAVQCEACKERSSIEVIDGEYVFKKLPAHS